MFRRSGQNTRMEGEKVSGHQDSLCGVLGQSEPSTLSIYRDWRSRAHPLHRQREFALGPLSYLDNPLFRDGDRSRDKRRVLLENCRCWVVVSVPFPMKTLIAEASLR